MTREEYLNTGETREERTAAFAAYYAQYVTPAVRALVVSRIGFPALFESRDHHFNDIRFESWDKLESACRSLVSTTMLKANGEMWSRSSSVCILKVAARQIVDLHTKQEAA